MITQDRLKEVLQYNAETGEFIWKVQLNARGTVGSQAGTKSKRYRKRIRVDGVQYFAYKLAWLYVHGQWPTEIDHINRDDTDDRIANLRVASRSENNFNRRDPVPGKQAGITWFAQTKRWRARIKVNRKEIALGYFVDIADAIAAREAAELKYFPGFARG